MHSTAQPKRRSARLAAKNVMQNEETLAMEAEGNCDDNKQQSTVPSAQAETDKTQKRNNL